MVSSENDGGVGGKFLRRPFRRAPATPYDRPQAAVRRANPNRNPNNPIGGNNGWISKIVDPASRIIALGASKLFASVFQKRLTCAQPPTSPPPEENLIPGHRTPEAAYNAHKPSEKAPEQKGVDVGENVAILYSTDGCQQEILSGRDGFIELEKLLKKKTFTRGEFDRLTDLLRSRTVEPSTPKQPVDYQNKEDAIVAEEAQYKTQSIVEPSTSQLAFSFKTKENIIISEQEDKTKSSSLHGDIKDSAVVLHIPEEEAVSPTELAKEYMDSRPSKVSPSTLSLRSQILQEDSTLSTEPYPKKPSMALLASRPSVHSSRIAEHSENCYMTPRPRGRSALYKMSRSPYFNVHKTTNITSGRPVRDGLASSSMSSPPLPPNMLSTGKKVLKRGSAVLDSDVGSFGPIRRIRQKSDLMSPNERHSPRNLLPSLTAPHQDVNERSAPATQKTFAGVTHVPPQSTEMARKIFLELDKLVPSPREKLSEKKASGSPLPSLRNSISPKQNRIKDNPSANVVSAVKATDEVVGMDSPATSFTDIRSSRKIADTSTVSDSAAIPSKEEPAFQKTTAEMKSLEWGMKNNMGSASGPSVFGNDKVSGKSLASPSKSVPASSSMLKGEVDMKASDRPATEKRVDIMLSPAPALGSQPSPTPAIPPSLADSSVTKKELSAPAAKTTSEGLTTNAMKVGASATPTVGIIESSGLDRGGKTQNAGDLHKSFENGTSSSSLTSSSSVFFTSGASTGPSQNNGSLTSFSSFPVPAGSAAVYFSNINTTANSGTQSVSAAQSIVAPTPFQFGSGMLTCTPFSVPVSGDKSDVGDSNRKSVKTSPLDISCPIAPGNTFLNMGITGSSPATSSAFPSIGGSSSTPSSSSSVLLNTASGSSLPTASSVFSSPVNGIFGFSASAQSSSPSSSFTKNNFSNSGSHIVGTAGSTFNAKPTQFGSGTTSLPDSSAVQSGSFSSGPTFGLNSSSSLNSVTLPFGDATSVGKAVGSHTCFSSAAAGSSSIASIPSFAPIASSSLFNSITQPSSSSMLPSTSESNPFLPSSSFLFGPPAPSGKTIGTSSGPVFSFSSARTTTSAASPFPAQPVSNIPTQGTGFGLSSPGDDQMNVEDAMVDDTIQASAPSVPAFGQPANSLSTPNLQFDTPAAPSGGPSVFQFGSNQNSPVPQNPFQSAGSFEFSAGGGSFSLGSGAGDKSGRRIVRVKRDKHRKK